MTDPAFLLSEVTRERDGIRALSQVTVAIPDGKITALIGPSAAGKTALLRLLNRLDDPSSGEIRYRGNPIDAIPVGELRRRVAFVFQTPVVFPGTVADNLAAAGGIAGIPAAAITELIRTNMQLVELGADLADRDAGRLSVGQKQRLNMGRALMTGPETLLLDESTASLDPETAGRLVQTIARLSAERSLTVVMATHRLTEAIEICDYAVMLDSGELVTAGTRAEVFDGSTNPRVRTFLNGVK